MPPYIYFSSQFFMLWFRSDIVSIALWLTKCIFQGHKTLLIVYPCLRVKALSPDISATIGRRLWKCKMIGFLSKNLGEYHTRMELRIAFYAETPPMWNDRHSSAPLVPEHRFT